MWEHHGNKRSWNFIDINVSTPEGLLTIADLFQGQFTHVQRQFTLDCWFDAKRTFWNKCHLHRLCFNLLHDWRFYTLWFPSACFDHLQFSLLMCRCDIFFAVILSFFDRWSILIKNSASYQILTGTELPTYRQRFSDGQEESVQYCCCQNDQGTECATCALCNIFSVVDNLYIQLKSCASRSLICLFPGWHYSTLWICFLPL